MPAEYYERLGVSSDASESEIKQAFRDRIKESHPDVSDDESASDRTKKLIEAKDVLTDSAERQRYDRIGHEAYVDGQAGAVRTGTESNSPEDSPRSSQDERTARTGTQSATGTAGTRQETGTSDRGAQQTADTESQQSQGQSRQSTNWYDSTRREQSTASTEGSYHAWDTDRSYAVGDSAGMFSPEELLNSQRTIALLGTTFVIYPVLLFGALFPQFPPTVNLTVGLCIVLVIAFMQSIPQVGILVFGTWMVLLPILLFGVVGVGVFTVTGVLALAAVAFPLGLSVLTWIALGPTNR